MSNQRPDFIMGSYYHIYNRGANKQFIFKERSNYLFVLQNLKKYSIEFDLSIIAYCLMPNHYHILIRQNGEPSAGLLPQRVFNRYTKAFNSSYSHSGTLFEGPYRIKCVDDDSYLIHLCKYIHLNPVNAGLVRNPVDWEYSNIQEFIGKRKGSLFDPKFFEDYFDGSEDYLHFVNDNSSSPEMSERLAGFLRAVENK